MACLVIALLTATLVAACSGPGDDESTNATGETPSVTSETGAGATTEPTITTASGDNLAPTATVATDIPASATTGAAPATATTALPDVTATTTTPDATPADEETMILSVYFLRDEKIATAHRELPATQQVGAAAMQALLEGPIQAEVDAGLSSSIPDGTEYLGLAIEETVATVDLSGDFEAGGGSLSMQTRLAQVVYTLTQFPTVETVRFALDGEPIEVFGGEGIILEEPVGRADFEDVTPLIFVESPAVGDTVSSPLNVVGTANTFEAVFQLQVLDGEGSILVDEVVMATSGTGTRGTFDITVEFDAPTDEGIVRVLEYSARDGSEVNVVEIPVLFE